MPVRTPQVEPGPGGVWQQWVLLWGQRRLGPGYRVTARAQKEGAEQEPRAWMLPGPLRGIQRGVLWRAAGAVVLAP